MVERLVNSEANARRIAMVESCFGTSGQPLSVPGRVLVGEGVLTKMCRKKPKPRQFFLFNDILVYGNIVINKKKYNKQHIIPLEQVKLENLEDEGTLKNGWLMCTASKSFAVYAATTTEKSEWMAHINKCVEDLLRKGGKKPTTEHAAVWVPDSEAPVCMHCKRTQFTVLNRRHHCRKCGSVVCNPCSNKKFLLPNQSSKPLRVCLTCYDELCKGKFDSGADFSQELHPSLQQVPRNGGRNMESSGEDDTDEEEESKPEINALPETTIDIQEPRFYDSVKETAPAVTIDSDNHVNNDISITNDSLPPPDDESCPPAMENTDSTTEY